VDQETKTVFTLYELELGTVRERCRDLLRNTGTDASVLADCELVVTELATNAFVHAGPPIVVSLRLAGSELVVEVTDGNSDRLPELRPPDLNRRGGRGLWIVAALAAAWGWTTGEGCKTTWAHINLAGTSPRH